MKRIEEQGLELEVEDSVAGFLVYMGQSTHPKATHQVDYQSHPKFKIFHEN